MSLAKEVRKRRRALNLTLEDLAHRAGLSAPYLSTIEGGKRDPSVSTVLAVAKALQVPPGELLGVGEGVSAEALSVARMFDAAPEDVQAAIGVLLRSVTRKR